MATTATAPARPRAGRERSLRREGACRPEPGRATLDDRISAVWTRLVEAGEADCPVCASTVAAGRPCGECGSELT
jgi:hypothetical protein